MSTFSLAQQLRSSMQRLGFAPQPLADKPAGPDTVVSPAERRIRLGQGSIEDLYALRIDGPARSLLR